VKLLVLVTGAGGQLGEAMTAQLGDQHVVEARLRDELDITDPAQVQETVADVEPDVIINCAAYNDVNAAEHEPVSALAANAWGVRWLARAAEEHDATLVHFSTDFVFDGRTDRPYVEEDTPNPRGTYAASKLLGEWLAAEAPRHYVLRVESLFGGLHARSSVDRMLDAILAGAEVRAFRDRTVSPSFVDDVVAATESLLELGAPFGLYHCVNSGMTTWAHLAHHLAALTGRPDARIIEVAQADAHMPVARPLFAALSNEKLTRTGVAMPPWQDALEWYVKRRM